MKRITLLLIGLLALQGMALADDDRSITVDQLPEKSREFINSHFSDLKVAFAKMEKELFDTSYEVFFTNGNKIEFDKEGAWKEINCKFSQVPSAALPKQILDYITRNNSGQHVSEIDKDNKDYEVKLNNGIELIFDLKFNFIGFDH